MGADALTHKQNPNKLACTRALWSVQTHRVVLPADPVATQNGTEV